MAISEQPRHRRLQRLPKLLSPWLKIMLQHNMRCLVPGHLLHQLQGNPGRKRQRHPGHTETVEIPHTRPTLPKQQSPRRIAVHIPVTIIGRIKSSPFAISKIAFRSSGENNQLPGLEHAFEALFSAGYFYSHQILSILLD
jgi:hypothetical protein